MSRKHDTRSKSNIVWQRTSVEETLAKMPKYNAYLCATGPHGGRKYNRAVEKRNWKKEVARDSGHFLLLRQELRLALTSPGNPVHLDK